MSDDKGHESDNEETVNLLAHQNDPIRRDQNISPSYNSTDSINSNPAGEQELHQPSEEHISIEEYAIQRPKKTKIAKFFKLMKRLLLFLGPGVFISIGFIDPGNFSTDIDAGSNHGYSLLWILVASNFIAILLQQLASKVGLVTGKDLAQQCANFYPKWISFLLWIVTEIAIAATDLAEVLGTAIGLQLLFQIPLIYGVFLTALDTFVFLFFQNINGRLMEFFILLLLSIISICFVLEVFITKPDPVQVLGGLIPTLPLNAINTACGLIGAVVMPHNIHLQAGIVLSRRKKQTKQLKDSKIRRSLIFSFIDIFLSLNLALFVNGSILVVAAATFYGRSVKPTEIQDAYKLLSRIFGKGAGILFGVALLCAGQSSTITGTIAGEIIMSGFLKWKIRPWIRRIITRAVAIIPAAIIILVTGDSGNDLLIWSQIVLSLQLPFTVIPLLRITARKELGVHKNHWTTQIAAWLCVLFIVAINCWLVLGNFINSPQSMPIYFWIIAIVAMVVFLVGLLVITYWPLHPKEPVFIEEEKRLKRLKRLELLQEIKQGHSVAVEQDEDMHTISSFVVDVTKNHIVTNPTAIQPTLDDEDDVENEQQRLESQTASIQ